MAYHPDTLTSNARTMALLSAIVIMADSGPNMREPREPPRRLPLAPPPPKVKAGRNGACPCGSGRKFKRCCHNALERVP